MLGIEEFKERGNLWITRGINNRVTVANVMGEKSSVGNPRLVVTMHLEGRDPKNATRFYIPMGGPAKKGIEKIVHLATALGITREQVNSCDSDDIKQVGTNFNTLMTGKIVNRMKFCGEEYLATDGSGAIKVRTVIGLPRFAEGDNVSEAESQLHYDENLKFDYKKYIKPEQTLSESADLPV